MKGLIGWALAGILAGIAVGCAGLSKRDSLVVVVMDPMARQNACACVKGYAQRDYDPLGACLSGKLGQQVRVVYGEDLSKARRQAADGRVALIIGKKSLVLSDAAHAGMAIRPLSMLTGKEGKSTLTGLFVVKSSDPARSIADIKGRRILFGPADSDEKHSAALVALRAAGVPAPQPIETRPGCCEAAMDIVDSKEQPAPAGVISSYAMPLLEGCGSVDRGALRIVGETAPVPFITVFGTDVVTPEMESLVRSVLSDVQKDPVLLSKLESKSGFIPMPESPTAVRPTASAAFDWPGWRGANRDGVVPALPDRLPASARWVWQKPLLQAGLAGLAVANGLLYVAERNAVDEGDQFRCLRADNGEQVWSHSYPAPGQLDYGQSPRATPLVHDGKVYLLGAFGDLNCLDAVSGKVMWTRNIQREFGAKMPKWGYSASPFVVGDKLIVNPGGKDASLAALDRLTGQTIWTIPGNQSAYASFIVATLGGKAQIVGYDVHSLGGWDPEKGTRLWKLTPPSPGDFNVPTPVVCDGQLLVSTENNGARLYAFNPDGTIQPKPVAEYGDLNSDVNSPVVLAGRVFGCAKELCCLDPKSGLKPIWKAEDAGYGDFVSLIGGGNRLLVITYHGELILVAAAGPRYQVVSRLPLFGEGSEIYSHPALAGSRLFIRDGKTIGCVNLGIAGETKE